MELVLALDERDTVDQLREERDEALALLQRVEASRNDLARQQGQYKGRIAKLEGAITSTEKHISVQKQEQAALKMRCVQLEKERAELLSRVNNTPDRCRADKQLLQAQAKKAVKLVYTAENHMKWLEQAIEQKAQHHEELAEFASLELSATAESEQALAGRVAELEAQLTESLSAQDSTEAQLSTAQEALVQAKNKVKQITAAHSSCAEAAEKAQKELRVLRGTCQQLTHDRMQSIANVRKAESEVDLIHQANEQMFRYLKYVQQRLSSHTAELEASPELIKLLRDLHMWCARESSGRCATPVTPSMCGSSAGKQASKTCGTTPVFRGQTTRPALMASCRSRLNP